ncbi:unnamed protein product, partial [Discosporangium mesarthrocarpum]
QADSTADAAVGNVTGSNSVNVFLGLGLPWTMAAIHWGMKGRSPEWEERYGGPNGPGTDSLVNYPNGGFAMPAGNVGSSVAFFTLCGLVCIMGLLYRRKKYGGELGGP